MQKLVVWCLMSLSVVLFSARISEAGKCSKGSVFNPITEVAWNGIFPLRVGGVKIAQGPLPDSADASGTKSPICACKNDKGTWLGLEVGFWDINNLVEVVQEPGCSPTIGASLMMNDRGFFGGTVKSNTAAPFVFKQAHWIKFPVIGILGLLKDMKCITTQGGFDYAYFTEPDPTHNSDLLAVTKRPDNLVFAFPGFDLLQPANVLLAHTAGDVFPAAYDSMFWLWWDTIYPLSGSKGSPHDLESSSQVAARQIYMFYGTGILRDNVKNVCNSEVAFMPKKSHWRFQLAKPKKTPTPYVPGQSEFLWGLGGKNPPFKEGNFLYVLFQRKRCCEQLYSGSK